MLRLPHEVKDVFRDWLQATMPERAAKVMSLVKSVSGGKDYDAAFGKRQTGTGPYAWTIGRRFELACQRLGLNRTQGEALDRPFPPPAAARRAVDAALSLASPSPRVGGEAS